MGLSKVDFIARVNARIAGRYGEPISEVWLNDRIKDGLLERSHREKNVGISPQFFATACHYRRALQIKRLEAGGIRNRNAVMLQLFVRRYNIPASVAASALESELRRSLKLLKAQLKSNYFYSYRSRGHKFEEIISKQMGELDDRFAHLELSTEKYFQVTRGLFQHDFEGKVRLMTGLLASGLPFVERVRKSSPDEMEVAGNMLFDVNRYFLKPHFGDAVLKGREIVAVLLSCFLWLDDLKPSNEQLLAWIDTPPTFETLLHDFVERIERLKF